ncbi:heme-binding domain-containing protein [Polaribacter sargassicola]|uniref:heme-binding domain-containing protein n=1 Tax=Polaribacter sargassicola TaxID=2836891 RepID=UPI001F248E34|nr:heme-binding domain-containing protein [Polaribacter sp. DS7-9]MCG1034771.1 heme-binding domain-containing protein [Polaribacter sp. DS7-9]
MKIFKKIVLLILIILLISQFFGPEKNEGELSSVNSFLAETNPPENVKKILKESCYDCHSNVTVYPWYSKITPVNYWLDDHIKDGKKHLNFSEWSNYSLKKKEHKMDELYEEVEEGKMPLDSYTWVHTEANLSEEQIEAVVAWGKKVQADYKQQLNAE